MGSAKRKDRMKLNLPPKFPFLVTHLMPYYAETACSYLQNLMDNSYRKRKLPSNINNGLF
jgi:hypothetical protein